MADVLPLAIRLEQGPDEEHRGASSPDETGHAGPNGQNGRVGQRGSAEVTGQTDSTRDGVEAEQEDDEGHVLVEDRMSQYRLDR